MAQNPDRRKRHKAALAILEITQKDFAESLGVSQHHLGEVLRGRRTSPRLDAAIDEAIAAADRQRSRMPHPTSSAA